MFITKDNFRNEFLNRGLKEDVSILSPKGIKGFKNIFNHLRKELYRLKQAHITWKAILCKYLYNMGFNYIKNSPCVLHKASKKYKY